MNKNIAVTGKGYARPVKKFCDIRDLVVLRFDGVSVRVVYVNGDPWFVAVDVCAALEIVDHKVALRRLDDDEKGECNTHPRWKSNNANGMRVRVLQTNRQKSESCYSWHVRPSFQ